jgi:hypothetical protein
MRYNASAINSLVTEHKEPQGAINDRVEQGDGTVTKVMVMMTDGCLICVANS